MKTLTFIAAAFLISVVVPSISKAEESEYVTEYCNSAKEEYEIEKCGQMRREAQDRGREDLDAALQNHFKPKKRKD